MKIALQLSGRGMKEPTTIVNKLFDGKTSKKTNMVVQKPTEGKWFDVNPQAINQKIFKKKREDPMQEWVRQRILEAFSEMKSNPEKYARPFETMIPEENLTPAEFKKLEEYAGAMGGHVAYWVEEALEWAQRIHNGEKWDFVCNQADAISWYRVIIWKSGHPRIVGGSANRNSYYSATDVLDHDYSFDDVLVDAVPKIVRYK